MDTHNPVCGNCIHFTPDHPPACCSHPQIAKPPDCGGPCPGFTANMDLVDVLTRIFG